MLHVQQPQTNNNQSANTATGLHTKALLANLSISMWSGRKHDKQATREVEEAHNAQRGEAGRFNKMLTNKEFLAGITSAAGAARNYLYENTLPWGLNGDMLLPSANYFDFINGMQNFETEFMSEVEKAADKFEGMLIEAQTRLNGLYNPADYPTRSEFKSKFSMKVVFMPIPETSDFRLDLTDTEVNVLKQSIENEIKTRIADSVSDIWQRVKEQLIHMKDRLTGMRKDKDGNDKPATFRDSLFDNLKDIIDLLPKLNITNDPALNEICEEMKGLLHDPETVRTNSVLRNRAAREVDEILEKFNGFFQ